MAVKNRTYQNIVLLFETQEVVGPYGSVTYAFPLLLNQLVVFISRLEWVGWI